MVKPTWSNPVLGVLLWLSMKFDSVSNGVTLCSLLSEFILQEIRENIVMRKLRYTEPLNKRICSILIHEIRGILEDKFA